MQEQVALLRAAEAIQGQGVVARDEVRVQRCLLAPRGHRLQRFRGHREPVPDSARLDHHVVGAANEHLAANGGDHPARTSVPLAASAGAALVLAAWQIATPSASAAWSDSGRSASPRSVPTIR